VRKTQNKGSYTVQVIQGIEDGINRKPVCDFLLLINTNWHLIPFRSYRSLLFKFWTLCVFESPFGSL